MKDSRKPQKKKKNTKSNSPFLSQMLFWTVPFLLLVLLATVYFINTSIKREIANSTLPTFASEYTLAPYPLYKQQFSPFLSAQSAIVMEDASKVVLFSKNPTLRFSTASTAKIMTALVGLEYFANRDILTVFTDTVEGTVVGIKKGQQFYFEDLLYGMLLPSGNDAAFTIAENYPGGTPAFVAEMNEKARSLHLQNMHFADPAGLDDDGNFSSAQDLANLSSYAIKNKTFASVMSTKRKVISDVDGTKTYELSNLNKLLGVQGVTGIKTGFTQGAGGVLTTAKVEKGHTFILVVMKSQDRFYDTQNLLSVVSGNVTYFEPVFQFSFR